MPSVVIADDEHPVRLILAAKLRAEGYVVTECRDGDEAFEAIMQAVPDLLITDFQMPMLSGLSLAIRLKAEPKSANLPVLMLSARGHAISADDMSHTNIRHILPKPFSAKQVIERVREILSPSTSSAT